MVGKDEGAAQRYARLVANVRLNNNAQDELTDPATVSADFVEGQLSGATRKAQEQANAVLNADESVRRAANWLGMSKIVRGDEKFRRADNNGNAIHNPFNYGNNAVQSAFNNFYNRGDYVDLTSPGMYFVERSSPSEEDLFAGSSAPAEKQGIYTGPGVGARTKRTKAETPSLAKASFSNNPITFSDNLEGILAAQDLETQKAIADALESSVETTPTGQGDYKPLKTWMRYAPIVGGGLAVLSDAFSQPDYTPYEQLLSSSRRLSSPVRIPVQTIGARLRRNPFDERLAVNQANQNLAAGLRSTIDNAGGNRAYRQFANNLMAYNNQGQLADIARNTYMANRQDALQTADFNRQTDIFNANAINQRNLTEGQLNANRQMQSQYAQASALQALENARRYDNAVASANFTNFMQNLGNLGRENFTFNQIGALGREGLINLIYGPRTNGDLIFNSTNAAHGGKVKTKKRRF